MSILRILSVGQLGVIRDILPAELPPNAWSDASNIRFINGSAFQFNGHGQVYGTPSVVPYHVIPVNVGTARYWLYVGNLKVYAVTVTGGSPVHTNLTRQTASVDVNYANLPNEITSTVLSGIPIFNPGNTTDPPQRWDLNIANRMTALDNWPASTFCKSLRAYKYFLIALDVTASGTRYPFRVKWSNPAEAGAVPTTWDINDATADAGEYNLAEGGDYIMDGLQLGDSFMIYKESSVWSMSYIGGINVMGFRKVLGISGAINRNCIVEVDGWHVVLTSSDVIRHDGQTAVSLLDDQGRRALLQDFDVDYVHLAHVFKNPFLNEVFVAYVSIGATVPDKALVWNYKDRTITFRTLPNVYHAGYGAVDNTLSGSWAADGDPWASDLTAWNGPDFTPNTAKVLMASSATKLHMLDASASYDGVIPVASLERTGFAFGEPELYKLMTRLRPRITGNEGMTVLIDIGTHDDLNDDPTWTEFTYTIGTTFSIDPLIAGRYLAWRFRTGTAYIWRLDGMDIEYEIMGGF